MTAVAYNPEHDLSGTGRGRGVFEPLVPAENLTEQTTRIPLIPASRDEDTEMVVRTGLGWIWPLWHRFDPTAKVRELRDPEGLHGQAGGWFVFAVCDMVACPDESTAPASVQDCPVCFADDSGHLFVWDRSGGHTVAKCILPGCEKTDAETRDPNTGRRRRCVSSTREVSS
ncbi:hypothetical protein C8D87_114185 [Lentzea atacamensis]|uniref:Uncharacterized protein n=1 Tax=Lentzea atacamensis TaxID=531938 RepID=A0ABX9DWA2_9PSEU|nr:hypothetical protein [Lentzea atacamensis]RAS59573.1 hypothetical protein C8D87_114185 [Lentzea atacamensis]